MVMMAKALVMIAKTLVMMMIILTDGENADEATEDEADE